MAKAKPRIEIYQYYGKFGGFDFAGRLLWKCDVVGVDGSRRGGGDWMAGGHGNPDRKYAQQQAESWATFTGWPVVDLGRVTNHDEIQGGKK